MNRAQMPVAIYLLFTYYFEVRDVYSFSLNPFGMFVSISASSIKGMQIADRFNCAFPESRVQGHYPIKPHSLSVSYKVSNMK
jgi:hypothetical protein